MSKNPKNKLIIRTIVKTSQSIEGYNSSTKDSMKKAQELMKKYDIKVSPKVNNLYYGIK